MTSTTSHENPAPGSAASTQSATNPNASTALLALCGIGAAVSVTLGVYGKYHTPTLQGLVAFGFPAVLPMKAWFASVAVTLATAQLLSALWIYDRLPGVDAKPAWLGAAHRWTGTLAFLFTLPVAFHCLWSMGFKDTDARVLTHSLLGCAFFGAFTTKMLVLRSERVPQVALPIVGGLLFTALVVLWLTSSLWYFRTTGFPGV